MEKDNEVKGEGNSLDFGARVYDPRLIRFLSLDPKMKEYPQWSPYLYAANSPLRFIDVRGKGPKDVIAGFTAAMIDYGTMGFSNLRTTKVSPENAKDFTRGLMMADAYMVAISLAEIGGGTGLAGGATITVTAGVATLVVPGFGEVSFVVLEVAGAVEGIAGATLAAHGTYMLKMAKENIAEKKGYKEGNVPHDQRDAKRGFSKKQVDKKYEENAGQCEYCSKETKRENYRGDHKKAHAKGGRTEEENLAGSCKNCNLDKSDKEIGEGQKDFKPSKPLKKD